MIHKRLLLFIFLVVAFIAIVACSEQETLPPPTKVENESKPTVVENKEPSDIVTRSDADKALATEMLKTIESYLKKQTTPEIDAQLAETIESNIDLISETNRANFSNIAKHIRNGEKEEVVPLFAALMENYELGTVTVNNVDTKESNEPSTSTSSKNIIASLDPNEVKKAIEEYAKEEWADDKKMQLYEIEEQTKAYNELIKLSIDDDALKGILDYSYDEWKNDYRMVLYEFQEQLDALIKIKNLDTDSDDVKKKILENSISEWGTDYRMVLYEYNKQLEAHESLK